GWLHGILDAHGAERDLFSLLGSLGSDRSFLCGWLHGILDAHGAERDLFSLLGSLGSDRSFLCGFHGDRGGFLDGSIDLLLLAQAVEADDLLLKDNSFNSVAGFLLEQAVYAPSSGRYKVYMIDEVHMLTGHAFNAMLKVLRGLLAEDVPIRDMRSIVETLAEHAPRILAPVTGLLGGLGGGEAANGGLLAPVTGLLGGLGGGEAANGGLLAPVTNLVGGLTGGLAGGDAANGGLLTPVTNLVGGLTGGLAGGDAANGGLLTPVTNLVGGLTGGLAGGDAA
ncbi:hemagglutinin-related transmembrane protein, partial [Alcaligenes faecalis subsp. faecalis NCIB 8687]